MPSFSHPSPQPATPTAAATSTDHYEKPAISHGALRAAVLGLLAVACVIGSLLLHWLHAPATPTTLSAGKSIHPVPVSTR